MPSTTPPTNLKPITVIMPLGDDLEFLDAQLAALAQQTIVDRFELLLSYNHPAGIAAGPRPVPAALTVRHLDTSDTPGAAWATNRAAAVATGDVLLFCHADDIVAPDWAEALAQALTRHAVVAGVCEEDSLNEGIKQWRSTGPVSSELGTVDPLLPRVFCGANCGYRRDVFEFVGGYDPRVAPCEDVAMAFDLHAHRVPVVVEPGALISYRHRRSHEGFLAQFEAYGKGTTMSVACYRDKAGLRLTAKQYVARVEHWLAHSPDVRRDPWIRPRTERYLVGCHTALARIEAGGITARPPSLFDGTGRPRRVD